MPSLPGLDSIYRKVQSWYADPVCVAMIREHGLHYLRTPESKAEPSELPFACVVVDELQRRLQSLASDKGRVIQSRDHAAGQRLYESARNGTLETSLTTANTPEQAHTNLWNARMEFIRTKVELACRPSAKPEKREALIESVRTVERHLSASSTNPADQAFGAGDTKPPTLHTGVALTADHESILAVLGKTPTKCKTVIDVASAGAIRNRETVGRLLGELAAFGMVDRPHGMRKGYALTDAGRKRLFGASPT